MFVDFRRTRNRLYRWCWKLIRFAVFSGTPLVLKGFKTMKTESALTSRNTAPGISEGCLFGDCRKLPPINNASCNPSSVKHIKTFKEHDSYLTGDSIIMTDSIKRAQNTEKSNIKPSLSLSPETRAHLETWTDSELNSFMINNLILKLSRNNKIELIKSFFQQYCFPYELKNNLLFQFVHSSPEPYKDTDFKRLTNYGRCFNGKQTESNPVCSKKQTSEIYQEFMNCENPLDINNIFDDSRFIELYQSFKNVTDCFIQNCMNDVFPELKHSQKVLVMVFALKICLWYRENNPEQTA